MTRQLDDSQQSLQQAGADHQITRHELADARNTLAVAETRQAALQQSLDSLRIDDQKQTESWQQERNTFETARRALEQSLHQAETHVTSQAARNDEQTARIRDLERQLADAMADHAKQSATILHLQEEIQQLDVAAAGLKESLQQENALESELRSKMEKREAELQATIHLHEIQSFELNNQRQQVERELQRQQQENRTLNQRHTAVLRDLKALQSDSAAAAMLDQARQQAAALTAQVSQLEARLTRQTADQPIPPARSWIRPSIMAIAAAWLLCIIVAYRIGGHAEPTPPIPDGRPSRPAGVADTPPVPPPPPPPEIPDPLPSPVEPPLATTPAIPESIPPEPESWPDLDLPDILVRESPTGRALVFDFGIFTTMTNLSPRALPALHAVADRLGPHMSRFKLIVEGHTDTVPVSTSHTSLDNHALAMARASLVAKLLTGPMALPPDLVYTTSAGEMDPPFSNLDDATRIKNRTVVLKLIPR